MPGPRIRAQTGAPGFGRQSPAETGTAPDSYKKEGIVPLQYFVDSECGDDRYDGQSRRTAFRTLGRVNALMLQGGDSVLFKAGCTYPGNLRPRREPGEGVVVFDSYGAGDKPLIQAPGGHGIDLVDFSGVELNNLAVENPNGSTGICARHEKGGCIRHTHIRRCDILNVQGRRGDFTYESGGILLISFCFEEPCWFDDVLVEDNSITDVCRGGILMTSVWVNRPVRTWGKNEYVSDKDGWWPSYHVVFRGNRVRRCAGDGIVIIGAEAPLMEWNVLYEGMYNPPQTCFNAGIWVQSTNDAVIQYNEVGYMHLPEGCTDGQGYDVDLSCRNTLVQYNYSHHNGGGFILLCESEQAAKNPHYTGTVVRNNLSVSDGHTKGETIAIVGGVHGAVFENNTFYSDENVERLVEFVAFENQTPGYDIRFVNNLFIADGRDNAFHLPEGGYETVEFAHNLYWGRHREVPPEHQDPIVMDPALEQCGAQGDGRQVGFAYTPREDSPIKTMGIPTEHTAPLDYFGREKDGGPGLGAL